MEDNPSLSKYIQSGEIRDQDPARFEEINQINQASCTMEVQKTCPSSPVHHTIIASPTMNLHYSESPIEMKRKGPLDVKSRHIKLKQENYYTKAQDRPY